MKQSKLVQIAQENEDIVRMASYYVNGRNIDLAVHIIGSLFDATTLLNPASGPDSLAGWSDDEHDTVVEVIHQGSVDGARELSELYFDCTPLILNFASAKRPGGGYLRGTTAQEEDLCRCSTLYFALKDQHTFYQQYKQENPVYSDAFIYNSGIPFFRDEDYSLSEVFVANVITCAAPNNSKNDISEDVLQETFERRIENILYAGLLTGNRDLVLGAWGCGVFNNDPEMVAATFAKLLNGKYKNKFRHVRFTVFDKTKELKVLEAFKNHLSK